MKDCDYYAMLKKGFGLGGVIERTLPKHSEIDFLIPDSIQSNDEKWMTLALLEAMNGIGWASPNPSVGCIVVQGEKVLARGFTQQYGGKHAERMAFESLQKNFDIEKLSHLQVYVTLEPCSHAGKQPPCVELLLHHSVQRIIVGCVDPFPMVSGSGIQRLKDAGKLVDVGVLGDEIRSWHQPFLMKHQRNKPLWIAKWAENETGLLADCEGNSKWITNSQSRAYTHWLRQKYDAILVGAGTWLCDQPKLTVRDCAEPHRRNPIILIHDPKKLIPLDQTNNQQFIFQQSDAQSLISEIEKTNFGFELQSIFCEGGAKTLNDLFRLDVFDVVHRFIGQKDFGALGLSSPHRISTFIPDDSNQWKLTTLCEFGNDRLQEWIKWS